MQTTTKEGVFCAITAKILIMDSNARVQTDFINPFVIDQGRFRWEITLNTAMTARFLMAFHAPMRGDHPLTIRRYDNKRLLQPGEDDPQKLKPAIEAACEGTDLSWSANSATLTLYDSVTRIEFRSGRPVLGVQPGQSAEEARAMPVKGLEPILKIMAYGLDNPTRTQSSEIRATGAVTTLWEQ